MSLQLKASSKAKRIFLRLILFLFLLIFIAACISLYIVRRSFPQTSGTIRVPGLKGPVKIYRDRFGVPQIYARNTHDLFLAQGYVHAQDRFWQMDLWRHTGTGRLSELFGTRLLETDRFLRTLGFARVVARELPQADERSLAILSDYAAGVNAYLRNHHDSALSLEYALLSLQNRDYVVEPWTPLHSLTWGKIMAWDLGENMASEITRSLLSKNLTAAQIDELYPRYPGDHPFILPDLVMPEQSERSAQMLAQIPEGVLKGTAGGVQYLTDWLSISDSDAIGSNNWVISGKRTATGKPILCNDPHLGAQMPSIWYQIGLHCDPVSANCPFDVAGFSFAGVPGIIIGHNNRIAWGFTNVGPDVMDLYLEKINPQNPDQYEVNSRWVNMQIVPEVLRLPKGDSENLRVRYTRHGPVISDNYSELKNFSRITAIGVPANYAIALRWTALDPSVIFPAIWKMNLAQNWNQFREAASHFDVPSQNCVYADVDGNIGYQLPGRIPIRRKGDGRYPVPGWTDDYEWTGFIPFAELPSALNPPSGFIATANNAVTDKQYPYFIADDWDYGFRAQRIVKMIQHATHSLSIADMIRIQGDDNNQNADALVPVLLQLPMKDNRLQHARSLLKSWDHQENMDSPAAALFETFWQHLLAETFHDDLPQEEWPGGGNRWVEIMRHLVKNPYSAWWDNKRTAARETRDQIFLIAFPRAVQELEQRFGADSSKWKWGALHTVTYRNASFGRSGIRPIEAIFNRGPYPTSGGTAIINATAWNAAKSFQVTDLPSMRMIADLSNWDNSLTVHSPGQSGHAYHPHYNDLVDRWRKIKYYPMVWNRGKVESNSESMLLLLPNK